MDKPQTVNNRFLIVCGGSGINLLGQLRILGFSAELQIDAGTEIRDAKGENRRFAIKLDEQIGAVADLLHQTKNRVVESAPSNYPELRTSVYLQPEITHSSDINHIKFLADSWVGGGNLKDGLAQAPAIGGATIKHPLNADKLKRTLMEMVGKFGIAPGATNPLEFWIVSSTAGGTGEGIHRVAGTMAAEVARHVYPLAPVALNFIRIGSLTYTTVNRLKTAINTLFGIAADAALEQRFKADFRNVVVNWYFVDLPDVGTNDVGKKARAEMVEMAGKAIMLPDLTDDLKKLLVNNAGSHAVVVRTGFWGRDFNEHVKYFETLKQLVSKLNALVAPEHSQYFQAKQPTARFDETEWESVWAKTFHLNLENPEYLQAGLEDGWEFPNYQESDLTNADDREKLIKDWKDAVKKLLGSSIEDFPAPLKIEKPKTEENLDGNIATQPGVAGELGSDDIFTKIDDAHRERAWCAKLLGDGRVSVTARGLLKDLHECAVACSRATHPSILAFWSSGTDSKARELSKHIWKFVAALVKVNTLINMDASAKKVLDLQLQRPGKVLEFAQKELEYVRAAIEGTPASPVTAADLAKTLDRLQGKSWLQLLDQAVQLDDRRLFKQEVLRGATGLTLIGLRSVLNLGQVPDASVIRTTLNSRMGRMVTPDGKEYEAQWWQAAAPSGPTMHYEYRILPELEPGIEEQLRAFSGQDQGPTYVFTKLGIIGLYVLGFEAISMNILPGPDTTSTYIYLMRPIVQIVKDYLHQWAVHPSTGRSGQFEIACGGVIGDPLDVRVLREGGLDHQEIYRIGQYYRLDVDGAECVVPPPLETRPGAEPSPVSYTDIFGQTQSGAAQPQPGGAPPQPGAAQPQPGGAPPQPGAAQTQPGGASSQPGAAQTQPGGASSQPGAAQTQPGGASSQPGAAPPGAAQTQPGSASSQPGAAQPQPGGAQAQP